MNTDDTARERTFIHWETHLARRLGLRSRDRMRELRQQHLKDGVDWVIQKKRVVLSEEAVCKLERALGIGVAWTESDAQQGANAAHHEGVKTDSDPLPSCGREEIALRPRDTGLTTLVVFRADYRNTKMISAHPPGTKPERIHRSLKWVRVRTNQNFCRGMEIPVRHVQAEQFELDAQCPRWRGQKIKRYPRSAE